MLSMMQPGVRARRRILLACLGAWALLLAGACAVVAEDSLKAEVEIDNFVFQPKPLQVKPGTAVTWTNHDDIPHSIVLVSLGKVSHPIDTDDSYVFTFDKAGTYDYICGLHPFMKGQVIVSP